MISSSNRSFAVYVLGRERLEQAAQRQLGHREIGGAPGHEHHPSESRVVLQVVEAGLETVALEPVGENAFEGAMTITT